MSLNIIGRTLFDSEKKSYPARLSKTKYYYISYLSRSFILDNDIKELPVNLNSILKNNSWQLIKYSQLIPLNLCEYIKIMKTTLGFSQYLNNGQYLIFYDDQSPEVVQRFTIAHEIGHIVLHHFQVPIENREQEANMFAARLLMPMCVLHECKIKDELELANLCNVSTIYAK